MRSSARMLLALMAAGCSTDSPTRDGAVDALDATEVDAAFWDGGPHGVLTLLESHPEVVCEPLTGLDYLPPARMVAGSGDLRWTYDLDGEPHFAGRAVEMLNDPFTGARDGGFTVQLQSPLGRLTVTPDGVYESFRAAADAYDLALVRLSGPAVLLSRDYVTLYAGPDYVSALDSSRLPDDGRVARSLPVVFPETGVVVWFAGGQVIQSNCLSGGGLSHSTALRWALQYDPRDLGSTPAAMVGLSDGSVIAATARGQTVRIGSDGEILARRQGAGERLELVSESCGALIAVDGHPTDVREWASTDDLATTHRIDGFLALPVADGETLSFDWPATVLPDCRLVETRTRTTPHSGSATTYTREVAAIDQSGTYWVTPLVESTRDSDVNHSPIPLADGGFAILQRAPLRATTFDPSGAMRWTRAYDETNGYMFVHGATVPMPDGVLYAATQDSLGDHVRLLAIELGPPAPFLWPQSGLNWARTSAPLPAGALPPDAGTLDAAVDAGALDAGVDAP